MKRYMKLLPAILLIFTGCMLWSGGVGRYREVGMGYGGISLRFETNPLAIDSLDEIRKQQQAEGADSKLTAWRHDYNLEIEDSNLGVSIESDVIYMWGDGKDMFGLCGISGCAMSRDKAYELWGSRDVLGKDVYIDGISYKVTCVTDNIPGIIAVKKDDYERGMSFVSLDMDPKAAGDESDVQIEKFILQNSHGADSSINYSDLVTMLGNFLVFPSMTVSALMCGRILAGLYCAGKYKKGCIVIACYAFFLIFWICICLFFGSFYFEIPGNFIPAKWSDFDFWTRLIEKYKNDLNGLRLMRTYTFDNYFRKSFVYISACVLLSSACFTAALGRVRNKTLNGLMAVEIVSAFIMFYAAAASGAQYGRYGSSYWLILPVYFIFDCFINNFNMRERT